MNPFTFRKLEYDRIVEMLVKECSSNPGNSLAED